MFSWWSDTSAGVTTTGKQFPQDRAPCLKQMGGGSRLIVGKVLLCGHNSAYIASCQAQWLVCKYEWSSKEKLQKRLNNANIVLYSLLFYFVHMSDDIVPQLFTVYITPLIYVCVFHRLSVCISVVGIFLWLFLQVMFMHQ